MDESKTVLRLLAVNGNGTWNDGTVAPIEGRANNELDSKRFFQSGRFLAQ